MTNYPAKKSDVKAANISFLITLILVVSYSFYVQPLKDILGDEPYLDLKIGGYSYDLAIGFFERLGVQGREMYMKTTLFDTIWPLAIAITAILYSIQLFKGYKKSVAAFFPVAFGILDMVENLGIFSMLYSYPSISPAQVEFTSIFTVTKQITIPGMVVMSISLPIVQFVRKTKVEP